MLDHAPARPGTWSGRRVAIVHDWFQGFHGSERVVDTMVADVFSQATCDVFTFHAARELLPERLASAIVQESRLSRLPGVRQRGHHPGRWRNLLPYMPHYFAELDLDGYDLWSPRLTRVRSRGSRHQRAIRLLLLHADALRMDAGHGREPGHGRAGDRAIRATGGWLREKDRAAAARVGSYAAISTAVQARIEDCYGREAEVIHPPVDTRELDPSAPKDRGRFLWVHRLVAYKHPMVVAAAFRGLPYGLTMVGIGPLEAVVRANLPENVELRGWLGREQLIKLYEGASGFIHVGEEDFGITMVEALAAGVPVIALRRGGACDIIRDGTDGVLIDEPSPAAIVAAVEHVASIEWDRQALAARAAEFTRERFVSRFGDFAARAAAGQDHD